MRGLYRYLSPFSSDQSGAASVFYGMGGIVVVVDAGGCAGNIAGFDERRFFDTIHYPLSTNHFVFSACLRDMDAILGRDDALVEKVGRAADELGGAPFAAYIGTPVPAVIGTDFKALCRMTEKRLGIKAMAVDTTGMVTYGDGELKAYRAIIDSCFNNGRKSEAPVIARLKAEAISSYARIASRVAQGGGGSGASPRSIERNDGTYPATILVWGATPLEMAAGDSVALLRKRLEREYPDSRIVIVGEDETWESMHTINVSTTMSLAVSPAGIKAARYLNDKCGVPYKVVSPISTNHLPLTTNRSLPAKHSLIIHQQCMANAVRDMTGAATVATFFDFDESIAQPGDVYIAGEDEFIDLVRSGGFGVIFGDPLLRRAVPFFAGRWVPLPHWAVSGQLNAVETEAEFMQGLHHE